jgi:hypothetical protein
MNPTEQRLQELLRQAVPDLSSVPLSAVAARVHHRRVRSMAGSTVAVVAVAAIALLVRSGGHDHTVPAVHERPLAVPTAPTDQQVPFSGVTFALPEGWFPGHRGCGSPPEHELVVEDRSLDGLCPYVPSPDTATTSVGLSTLYGRQYTLGWSGQPIQWKGQPAWIDEQPVRGGTSWTLALPLLNTFVVAQSRDASVARALLDRVSWTEGDDLGAPSSAVSVQVQSFAGHDGDGVNRSTTVTAAADVRELLHDLRALPVLPKGTGACGPDLSPQMAVLTVHRADGAERSFLARFASCHQVISGTGRIAATDEFLLQDIRRVLPASGL